MRKGKDQDPYLLLTDTDADPGGQKHSDPEPDAEHCWELSSRRRILVSVSQSRESDSDFDCGFSDVTKIDS